MSVVLWECSRLSKIYSDSDSGDYLQKPTMTQSLRVSTFKIGSFGQIWPKFDPNLVHLAHFVSGVGSINLIYVLAVVITFRNLL